MKTHRRSTSPTRSWSTARPGSICATKPSCSAHHTTAHGLRSSWRAATSRSSNMAGSNSSRRRTSRTCWQCCAGQENPHDALAGFRVLQLLPGIGPASARRAMAHLGEHSFDFAELADFAPPDAAALSWPGFSRMMDRLRDGKTAWAGQIGLVRAWYQPHLERLYDYAPSRAADLDQLEQIAVGYPSRERFLAEVTLDPPDASGADAGRPELDEDYLILSTIHSAKGQEWDAVYVLNLVDGCIPSDMATDKPAQIDEERRLLYVAMTRAKQHLHLVQPLRFFRAHQHRFGSGHTIAPRSRFLPDDILPLFTRL